MRLKIIVVAAIAALSCCAAVQADSPTPAAKEQTEAAAPISASKKAAIMELLKVTEADKRVDLVVAQMMGAHQRQYPMMIAQVINSDPNLTDAQKKEMIEKAQERSARSSERLRELFVQKIDLGKVMDEVALKVYDKNFTESELRDIIAFYKTPTGQKSLQQMPEVLKESMDLTATLIAPQMGQIIQQLMDEERARLKTADKNNQLSMPPHLFAQSALPPASKSSIKVDLKPSLPSQLFAKPSPPPQR